ncbi:hypothetical protein [Maribacter sp.]|uniref:hypothetical protein n=1 Tax=Maribacter sp. TaxID=1897614 RepID=UPI0032979FFC
MIKQRLVLNFENILRAKIYFFLKKSIWKYLIMTLVLGFLKPISGLNPIVSAVIYFIGINVILWPLQYLSAKTFAKKISFDADVEFNDREILIHHNNKELIENKDWNWIKKIDINKNRIWLTINQKRPFGISIPTNKLSEQDIDFFKQKSNK